MLATMNFLDVMRTSQNSCKRMLLIPCNRRQIDLPFKLHMVSELVGPYWKLLDVVRQYGYQKRHSAHYCTLASNENQQCLSSKAVLISELTGMQLDRAVAVVEKIPQWKGIHNERLKRTCFILRSKQITDPTDITLSPYIFALTPDVVEQRYLALKELGLINIGAQAISRFKSIMDATTKQLRSMGHLNEDIIPLDNLLSCLSLRSSVRQVIEQQRTVLLAAKLQAVRNAILIEYLRNHLNLPKRQLLSMLQTYSIVDRSLLSVIRTWESLTVDVGLPKHKIQANFSLLKAEPQQINMFLTKFPSLGSLNIKDAIQREPRILLQKPANVESIYKLFLDYGVSCTQLEKCLSVFIMAPSIVKHRLQQFAAVPNAAAVMSSALFVKLLVYDYNTALPRLKYLQTLKMLSMSTHMLTVSDTKFRDLLHSKEPRVASAQLISFLADQLNFSKEEVFVHLRRRPKCCQENLFHVNEILSILKEAGFCRQQILNGLPIVFYSTSSVLKIVTALPMLPEAQPYEKWKDHYNVLQLVIHLMNKDIEYS